MIKKYKKIVIGIVGLAVIIGIYFSVGKDKLGAVFNITPSPIATTGEYQIISGVKGYVSKPDPTNIAPEYLVSGSQNVVINDQERIETRAGYELFGAASTTATAITSDYVWRNSGATSTIPSEILLRVSGVVLQYYSTSTFENLYNQISTSTPVRFASVWNASEGIDVLLFVNASSTLFEWSGGQGTLSATTTNTITIEETIGESRFFTAGTRQLSVKDLTGIWRTFTYTGISGSQFTGVSPDPISYSLSAKVTVIQAIRSNLNKPASGFVSDTIKVLNNQVWLGSQYSRDVYVSTNTSYTTFTFSSPRAIGEGAKLTLDDTTIGFESPDDAQMIVFSGKDRIYQVSFEISSSDTGNIEVPKVKPLLVSSGQGALSQELIGKIKQAVVWVSNNKELVELGQVENLPSPQAVSISDPIKPDFINADFTNGEIEFWRNSIFITAPPDGKLFIYDLAKRFWQPPQIIGVRRLSQYGDLLYGHGQSVPETYKLFTGLSDRVYNVAGITTNTAATSPGTMADDATVGTVAWRNVDNAKVSDNSYAIGDLDLASPTHYLKATNFGFSIPTGSTISGILVEVEKFRTTTYDNAVRIVKGGVIGSTDKSSLDAWPATDTYVSHGSSSDLWGETWTAEDINLSTFGFAISAKDPTLAYTCRVDHIRITVYYTTAAIVNANPIESKAHFSYVNGGRRDALKNFNRFFTEMYLASNTKVDVSILYDWLGSKGVTTYELDGADSTFLFIPEAGASIGVNPLGTNPLGGLISSDSDFSKYRRFKPLVPKDFFEYQVRFESNASSTAWQILSTGANISLSNNNPTTIIK